MSLLIPEKVNETELRRHSKSSESSISHPEAMESQENETFMKINQTPVMIRRKDDKIVLKLFVGQIPRNWDDKDVTNFFSKFGEIIESQVLKDKTGGSKNSAFVKFASLTRAEKAIEELTSNKVSLPGASGQIIIKWADGEAERLGIDPDMNHKLFVGSIPKEAIEQNLKDLFERFGTIEELFLMREQDGTSKGSCFIKYFLRESALLAIKNLHAQAYILNSDIPLEVRFAEIKKKIYNQLGFQSNPSLAQASSNPSNSGNPNKGMRNHQNTQLSTAWAPQGYGPINYSAYNSYLPYYGSESLNPYYYNPMMNSALANQYGAVPSMMRSPYDIGSSRGGNPTLGYPYDFMGPKNPGGKSTTQTTPVGRPPGIPGEISSSKIKQGLPGCNLFVFYLPNDWQDEDLYALFNTYGNVTGARVMKDKNSGRSKGFGFVTYDKHESALKAIEMLNGYQVDEKKRLKVELKKSNDDKDLSCMSLKQSFLDYKEKQDKEFFKVRVKKAWMKLI